MASANVKINIDTSFLGVGCKLHAPEEPILNPILYTKQTRRRTLKEAI